MQYNQMIAEATQFCRGEIEKGTPEDVIKYKLLINYGLGDRFYSKVVKTLENLRKSISNDIEKTSQK